MERSTRMTERMGPLEEAIRQRRMLSRQRTKRRLKFIACTPLMLIWLVLHIASYPIHALSYLTSETLSYILLDYEREFHLPTLRRLWY
jgi:hypothetical protein